MTRTKTRRVKRTPTRRRPVRRNRTLSESELAVLDRKLDEGGRLTKRESLDYLASFAFNAWEALPEDVEDMAQDDLDDVAGVLEAIEDAANIMSSGLGPWSS